MATTKRSGSGGKRVLKFALLRKLHTYLSVFVAPSLMFFALTGALQTFRVPDAPDASVLLVKLARVHRDDVFAPKPVRAPPPGAAAGKASQAAHKPTSKPAGEPASKPATEALKWFFAIASMGMLISTGLGLWMALVYSNQRVICWLLLIAGIAAPVALLVAAA